MPLSKKLISCIVLLLLLTSFFSGCILDDLFGGSTFSLNSWELIDNDGFAAINLSFSCNGKVSLSLKDPSGQQVYSDNFIRESSAKYHLTNFRHTVMPGDYQLSAYDSNGDNIFSKSFSFSGASLTINSLSQQWWKRNAWIGTYSLFGLRCSVTNSGDVPAYPYKIEANFNSESVSAFVLPCTIMPGDTENVDCYIYMKDPPSDPNFNLRIIDINEASIASAEFTTDVVDNVYTKDYSWSYQGSKKVTLPRAKYLYEYSLNMDRVTHEDYSLYVLNSFDDEYVDILADIITLGIYHNTEEQEINYIASFVQNLQYLSDVTDLCDYPRYPIETLYNGDGGGDCEDKAILMVSLLNCLGYNAVLLRFDDHMAVGVSLGENEVKSYDWFVDNYYFLETTTKGKPLGFIPSEYENSADSVIIHECKNKAVLSHNWQDGHLMIYTGGEDSDFIKVKCLVSNYGDITAENVRVEGAFYTLGGLKVNGESEIISSIGPDMTDYVILSINYPKNTVTRFKTRIYLDEEVVDERESASTFPADS